MIGHGLMDLQIPMHGNVYPIYRRLCDAEGAMNDIFYQVLRRARGAWRTGCQEPPCLLFPVFFSRFFFFLFPHSHIFSSSYQLPVSCSFTLFLDILSIAVLPIIHYRVSRCWPQDLSGSVFFYILFILVALYSSLNSCQ